jgi:hypothetical protein
MAAGDCGDLPANALVPTTAVLVPVSTAGCLTRLAVVLDHGDWAAPADAGLPPPFRGFWDVVVERAADSEDGAGASVPSRSELDATPDG